jgi:hypothetical protein
MNAITFDSQLLPDGHLYCPTEWSQKKKALFKVTVVIQDPDKLDASDHDLELSALTDSSSDFLSQEELNYYLALEDNL